MQIDFRLSIGASPDAPYVDSHAVLGETARRQVARRHRVEASLRSDRQYLAVGAETLADRRRNHSPMPPRITRGYLKHYAEQVAPAAEGAVIPRLQVVGSDGP